jgi:diguanylate cyclase (GGDEF)-like protein
MSVRAKLYIAVILIVGGVCALIPQSAPAPTASPWLTFLVLTILATIANLFAVEIPRTNVAYFATPVFIFAGMLLLDSYMFAGLVITCNLVEWLKERLSGSHRLRDWYIQPSNVAIELITAAVVRLVSHTLDTAIPATISLTPVLIKTVSVFVFVAVNHVLLGIALVVARKMAWRETGMLAADNVVSDSIMLLLGYVIAVLWEINPWLIVPALSPLILMYRALQVPALAQEAQTDSKTGLLNMRYFNKRFEEEFARARRFNRPLALMMSDLDFLRSINNTYGHLAGDAVIGGIGQIINTSLRGYDIAGRFGGEEFVIVLPETDFEGAIDVAERLRSAVEAASFQVSNTQTRVGATISIGVAFLDATMSVPDDLIRRADEATYQAKAAGRNCIQIIPPLRIDSIRESHAAPQP